MERHCCFFVVTDDQESEHRIKPSFLIAEELVLTNSCGVGHVLLRCAELGAGLVGRRSGAFFAVLVDAVNEDKSDAADTL